MMTTTALWRKKFNYKVCLSKMIPMYLFVDSFVNDHQHWKHCESIDHEWCYMARRAWDRTMWEPQYCTI